MFDDSLGDIRPASDSLTLINTDPQAILKNNNQLLLEVQKREVGLRRSQTSLEKSRFFPGLSVGYFRQNITDSELNLSGLQGWQVGVSFPLWFLPQKSRISQARILEEQAGNSLDYLRYNLNQEMEKLLLQLEQAEKQLDYYQQTALPQSDIIIRTADLQLEQGEIDYFRYLQSVSAAIRIRMDYLGSLNDYNQSMIQLSYYR